MGGGGESRLALSISNASQGAHLFARALGGRVVLGLGQNQGKNGVRAAALVVHQSRGGVASLRPQQLQATWPTLFPAFIRVAMVS